MRESGVLARVSGLTKTFKTRDGLVRAVDGVDLEIKRGTTLAIVGESGSGKTTLGRCILRLWEWDAGEVEFDGLHLSKLSSREVRRFRRHAQMVFQDPSGSLNPRMRVRDILDEPLRLHTALREPGRRARITEVLRLVHLEEGYASRFPGELSGGEQQRVGIARAIITEPKLIVLDEPTASLDAPLRKGIYNLLRELQARMGLTYLLISHDLSSVWSIADRVAVMYMGQMVELGDRNEVFLRPSHPYTIALISAAPQITPLGTEGSARLVLHGEPGAIPIEGCRFFDRCPIGRTACTVRRIELVPVAGQHTAACIRLDVVPRELGGYRVAWAGVLGDAHVPRPSNSGGI